MANIDNVQLPDGSSYNIVDTTSNFASQTYVDNAVSGVTKTTIGLGNVDNTADLSKPVSTAQQTAIDNAVAPKVNKTDIATVESGTTASRAYSVGDLVYVSGTLYRVKTAIASGATFTVGTNIEVTNVSESIASISGGGEVSPYYTDLSLNVEYTCPSDGYATVGCINNATSFAQLQIGVGGVGLYVYGTTAGYSANSAFVRKGTKLKLFGGSGNYWGRFYPIV